MSLTLARGGEDPVAEVVGVQWSAVVVWERQIVGVGLRWLDGAQACGEVVGDRDRPHVARFRCAEDAFDDGSADPHARLSAIELDVFPAQRDRFGYPQSGQRQQHEERLVFGRDFRQQPEQLCAGEVAGLADVPAPSPATPDGRTPPPSSCGPMDDQQQAGARGRNRCDRCIGGRDSQCELGLRRCRDRRNCADRR